MGVHDESGSVIGSATPTPAPTQERNYNGFPANQSTEVIISREIRKIVRQHGVESERYTQKVATLIASAMTPLPASKTVNIYATDVARTICDEINRVQGCRVKYDLVQQIAVHVQRYANSTPSPAVADKLDARLAMSEDEHAGARWTAQCWLGGKKPMADYGITAVKMPKNNLAACYLDLAQRDDARVPSSNAALREALETFKASVIEHLIQRAKYFERTTGSYSRKETANSYRQTAKEIERMQSAADLKPMPSHLGDAAYALSTPPVTDTSDGDVEALAKEIWAECTDEHDHFRIEDIPTAVAIITAFLAKHAHRENSGEVVGGRARANTETRLATALSDSDDVASFKERKREILAA